MREFLLRFDSKQLASGLFREQTPFLDVVELEEAKNVVSWRGRLDVWREVRNPIPAAQLISAGIELDYPFPLLYRGKNRLFLFTSQRLYYVDPITYNLYEISLYDINDTTKEATPDIGDYWHLVDFGDYWYAFNGVSTAIHSKRFLMRGGADVAVITNERSANAAIEFRGRAILGGLSENFWGVWESLFVDKANQLYDGISWDMPIGDDYIFWSNIGVGLEWLFYKTFGVDGLIDGVGYDSDNMFVLDLFQRNDAGFMRVPGVGRIMRIVPFLNKFLVVYGDNGICVLQQVSEPAPTFGIVMQFEVGVPHSGAVASNGFEHLFLGNDGALYLLTSDLKFQRLGYEEHFRYDLDLPVSVTYDRFKGIYYVGNRQKTFILGTDGLTWTTQLITGVVDNYGEQVALGSHFVDDKQVAIRTTPIEFTRPGMKTITFVRVGSNTPDKYKVVIYAYYNGGWSTVLTKPVNSDGETYLNVTARAFKVEVQADDYTEVAPVEYIEVAVKYTDKRYIRGTYVSAPSS